MADAVVGLRIQADGKDAVQTVGNIKKELRAATQEAIALSAKFGDTSVEAIEAAKRVAQLKDTIQDTNERIALFDPGAKFAAVGNALRTVAGGFSALTGAVALFGVESQEVEKTLLKVQAALALTEGLNTIADAGQAFDKLKIAATNALGSIRSGLLATGIGALVVALGAIVAYWDDITEAVNGVSAEQEKLNEETQKQLDIEQQKLDTIGDQDNVLRLQGKSEREILDLKIKQIDAVIEATRATIEQQKVTTALQTEAAARNQKYLATFLDFITIPTRKVAEFATTVINGLITVLNKIPGVDIDFKLNGQKIDEVNTYLAGFIFDPKKTAEEGAATIAESEKSLLKLQDQRAGFLLNIQNINNQAAEKAREERKKQAELDLQAELEIIEARKKLGIEVNGTPGADALKARDEARKAELAIDAAAEDERVALVTRAQATINAINKEASDNNIAYLQAEKAARDITTQSGIQAIGLLADLVGRQTAAGKVLALAEIAAGTAVGFVNALTIAQQTARATGPAAAFAFPVFYATQLVAVLGAAARAKSVLSSKGASTGGGAGVSGASAAAPAIPQRAITGATTLDQNSLNQIGNATTRAFVVESDVTNNQERTTRLNRAARLG